MKTFRSVDVNERAVAVFGYKSKKDFLNNFISSAHYIDLKEREKVIETLVQTGEIRSTIQEMQKVDGTRFWAKMFLKLNSEKTLAQVMLIDITSQIRYGEDLQAIVQERTSHLPLHLNEKEL